MTTQSGLSTDRWYFTKDEIVGSVSSTKGISTSKETSYRQQSALLIQEMGQKLKVNQLCINTAIVYMHRFFMCHPFTVFHRHKIAKACLFLSAKVEEQPRKLQHVINTAHYIINTTTNPNRPHHPLDPHKEDYKKELEQLVRNETIILQTLVVRCPSNDNGVTDLAKLSYFMATESLHLTTFCLQYKPNVVAAVCVHIACKWAKYELAHPDQTKEWWELLGPGLTIELLNEIATEFIGIIEVTPTKLKRMLNHGGPNTSRSVVSMSRKGEGMKRPRPDDPDSSQQHYHRSNHHQASHSMEKSVSDKLDMLIGSSKPRTGSSHHHHPQQHEMPSGRSGSNHHPHHPKPHPDSDMPPRHNGAPPPPSSNEFPPTKKPRTDMTIEQMKKLDNRLKREQLDSAKQQDKLGGVKSHDDKSDRPEYRVKPGSSPPPPPPPPPPLQRAPLPHIAGLRYNLPPPPLHMTRTTDSRARNLD